MASKTSFSCGSAVDIVNVNSLQQRLLKALDKSSTIELKADKVEKADSAGLQLFVAANKELNAAGGQMIWKKPSESLLTAAKQLGLTEALGL